MAEKLDFKTNPNTKFRDVEELSQEVARREIEALREGIDHHDRLYYVEDAPEIADAVYDELFHRLQELEESFPKLRSDNSPTRRVGAEPLDKLKTIDHAAPMLSLNAALEQSDFEDWNDFVKRETGKQELEYVLEPKFDGVSVEVVYDNRLIGESP